LTSGHATVREIRGGFPGGTERKFSNEYRAGGGRKKQPKNKDKLGRGQRGGRSQSLKHLKAKTGSSRFQRGRGGEQGWLAGGPGKTGKEGKVRRGPTLKKTRDEVILRRGCTLEGDLL